MTLAADRRVALEISEPLLAARLTRALGDAGARIVERDDAAGGCDTLLLGTDWPDDAAEEAIAEAAWQPVAAIKEAALGAAGPRHVLVAMSAGGETGNEVAIAALTTLIGYITTHTCQQRLSINGLVYPPTALGAERAAGVALAVTAGLLDEMRGQVLHLGED